MKIKKFPGKNKGFSLTEMMVAIVIGMAAMLSIVKMMQIYDGQKMKTSGGSDSQSNAMIALQMVNNEVQIGGYGFPMLDQANSILKCQTLVNPYDSIEYFFPVKITDGGTAPGASDIITVRFADRRTTHGGATTSVISTTGDKVSVNYSGLCSPGNQAIVTRGDMCGFGLVMGVAPGIVEVSEANNYVKPAIGSGSGGSLSCIRGFNKANFWTDGNDMIYGNGVLMMPNVVNIQAQYGISDTPTSNAVVSWVDATGDWANPSVNNRNRIKAIRVSIVTRSPYPSGQEFDSSCTTSKGVVNKGPCAWDDSTTDAAPKIDLSNRDDWKSFKYRSFDMIMPIRNVIWSNNAM